MEPSVQFDRNEIIFCFAKIINYCLINDIELSKIKLHFDDPQSEFYKILTKCLSESEFILLSETKDPINCEALLQLFKTNNLLSSQYLNLSLSDAYKNSFKRYGNHNN